jgi:hypothetical protein
MAAIPDNTHYRTAGAVYARDAWNAMQRHGTTAFQQAQTFAVAHPSLIQGLYYIMIGLWPVLGLDSFLAATGHKHDFWLAQKMGLLLVAVGCTLCLASYRRARSPEIMLLAVASAVLLGGAGLIFVIAGTISLIYLLDAVIQLSILGLWLHAWYVENIVTQSTATPPAATSAVASPGKGVVPTAPAAPPAPNGSVVAPGSS